MLPQVLSDSVMATILANVKEHFFLTYIVTRLSVFRAWFFQYHVIQEHARSRQQIEGEVASIIICFGKTAFSLGRAGTVVDSRLFSLLSGQSGLDGAQLNRPGVF